MITVLGILLLCFPFILVFNFSDRIKGFLYVSISALGGGILVALLTQSLHVFTYPLILSIYVAADLAVLAVFLYKKKSVVGMRLPAFAVLAFCIVFFELFSVHYHYTGIVETMNGTASVEASSYPYPIFSDEWVAASLANYSIESNALPDVNPLAANASFPNLLLPFDSLLALIFLILGLSSVADFAVLAVAGGMAICLALYISMRSAGIGRPAGSIAVLFVPLMTEGANLPGIWFLLPFVAGLVPLFLMLACLFKHQPSLAFVAAVLSVMLYPPLALFAVPALCAGFLSSGFSLKKVIVVLSSLVPALFGAAIILCILAIAFKIPALMESIGRAVSHPNLDGGIVSYALWNVMPVALLPFAAAGIYFSFREKAYILLTPLAVGAGFWIFYAYHSNVILIEYPRVVVASSLLLVVLAGLGIDRLLRLVAHRFPALLASPISIISMIVMLAAFGVAAWSYPSLDPSQKLVLTVAGSSGAPITFEPAEPVNRYLTPDDLRLWKGISGIWFVAPSWKGLVLGAAMDDYPVESKSAFITNSFTSYAGFVAADCTGKSALVRQYDISYAYSSAFDCPGFTLLGSTTEGLFLYRIE